MKICWKKGKSSAKVVYEESLKEKKRSYGTVKTTLDRLSKKGFLEREKFGPIWLYSPKVSKNLVVSRVVDDFSKFILNDSVVPIVMSIVNKIKTKKEIEELKRLIDELNVEDES